jgi:hypothetical protein
MQHEEVVGVVFRYVDASKKIVVIKHGKTQKLEQATKLESEEQSKLEVLDKIGWHRFPVFYHDEHQSRLLIGEMTLFIDPLLILKRHAHATLAIVISCAISAVVMWLIIRSVLNSNLAEPLRVLVIKLLQIQRVLPEGDVKPDDLRKLRIERFGTELRLLEKQLEKIVLSMAMATPMPNAGKKSATAMASNETPADQATGETGSQTVAADGTDDTDAENQS